MKLTIKVVYFRDRKFVNAVAVINASKKLGIPKRRQKTWRLMTVAPKFTAEHEARALITAEAKRWEQSILNPVIRKPQVQEPLL